jgi:magnesium transporter
MAKLVTRRQETVGAPPGTLVHVGDRKTEEARVTVMDYDEQQVREREVEAAEECVAMAEAPTVTWINVDGLHEVSVIESIGECFGLHPLVLEDILDTGHRPKLEDYEGYVYVVGRVYWYSEEGELRTEQISYVLLPNMVITFQEGREEVFESVRERIRSGQGRIRKAGADYLAYALLDAMIDTYFSALEELGDRIEAREAELVTSAAPETLRAIHRLKRDAALLRKSIWPLREVMSRLERGESGVFADETAIFLRDAYDHAIQVADTIETYRELLAGMLDTYLSSVSNRMNEVMKVLTIIATLFIPLTFVAGIYGMNFDYMPELHWRWAYPVAWAVMLTAVAVMIAYFRRRRWL